MIIIKEVNSDECRAICQSCNKVVSHYFSIEIKEVLGEDTELLNLCPACKTTLKIGLNIASNNLSHDHVKATLEDQIVKLKTDLECIGKRWKKKFGLPLTKERVMEQKDATSIGYMLFVDTITEHERVLAALK